MNETSKNIKNALNKIGNIFSSVFLVAAVALCVYVFIVNYTCNKSGEEPFYFGYRPCMIQTGSMEPYMMTNGIILTKEVDSIDDIAVGDVVTYKATNDGGKKIYITHRVIDITADGLVYTKGDNNNVDDGFALTMDNIIAKEVGVFNQPSVWVINTWESGTSGKIMIVCSILAVILLCFAVGTVISSWLNTDEIDQGDVNEYSKFCRKLGLSPAATFRKDLERLHAMIDERDAAQLAADEAGPSPIDTSVFDDVAETSQDTAEAEAEVPAASAEQTGEGNVVPSETQEELNEEPVQTEEE